MPAIKSGYRGLKTALAGLLALLTGAVGLARPAEAPARPERDAIIQRLSDSEAYDPRLAQAEKGAEEGEPMQMMPNPTERRTAPDRQRLAPRLKGPKSSPQPAQPIKLKPATKRGAEASERGQPRKLKSGKKSPGAGKRDAGAQTKQPREAWPAKWKPQPGARRTAPAKLANPSQGPNAAEQPKQPIEAWPAKWKPKSTKTPKLNSGPQSDRAPGRGLEPGGGQR